MACTARTQLQIGVTREAVFVQRHGFDHFVGLQQPGALVHGPQGVERVARGHMLNLTRHRAGRPVGYQAHAVAHAGRAKEGNDKVRPTGHMPARQGQAKVLLVARHARLSGNVEQTAKAQHGVDGDAHQAVVGPFPLELQQVVDQRPHVSNVGAGIAHARAHRRGHHVGIDRSHRLEHSFVQAFVEAKHGAVVRLPGVVLGRDMAGRQIGAACERQHGHSSQRCQRRAHGACRRRRNKGGHGETHFSHFLFAAAPLPAPSSALP